MKKNEKKMLLILIILAIVIIATLVMAIKIIDKDGSKTESGNEQQGQNQQVEEFVQVQEDGSKVNISTKLNSKKTFKGFEISDIRMTMSGGLTYLTATVKNNTGEDKGVTGMDITLLDKEGNKITQLGGVIDHVKAGETTTLTCTTTLDFANAYDFTVDIY